MFNDSSLQLVQHQLARFAAQDNFEPVMTTAFGNQLNRRQLQIFRQQWLSGNFSAIPNIQILSHGELGAANGAYAASLDKIFVSSDFLVQASQNQVTALILEEVGHRLDQLLNGGRDSAGDEGEIFSRLVNGENLSPSVLADLKAQNDHGLIELGGVKVAIEKQTLVFGGAGDDIFNGGDGDDYYNGLAGNDIIHGYNGNDYLIGGDGNDYIIGENGDDTISGDNGDDILAGADGNDAVIGGDGNDTLFGQPGNDTLLGDAGYDTLYGDVGDDCLSGGINSDSLYGGDGNDTLIGDASYDPLVSDFKDVIYGEDGDDTFFLNGRNYADGGNGNDKFTSYDGDSTLIGGLGDDYFDVRINTTNFALEGGLGNDTIISASLGSNTLSGGSGNDSLTTVGNDSVDGGDGNDTLNGSNGVSAYPYRNIGNSTLRGGSGDDYIFGSDGANVLVGGSGNSELHGYLGNDQYIIDADDDFGTHIIDESDGLPFHSLIPVGIDRIDFGSSAVAITIDIGSDAVQMVAANVGIRIRQQNFNFGGPAIDNVIGGQGNDRIIGNSLTNRFNGSTGDDSLDGGGGNDVLEGEGGNDVLAGGVGNDYLYGGAGNDRFIIDADVDSGIDTIIEYAVEGIDTIDFSNTSTRDIALNLMDSNPQSLAIGVVLAASSLLNIEKVIGGLKSDYITGNDLNNSLAGGGGNDNITGGLGDDSLEGDNGDDVYTIDADIDFGTDTITELAGGGIDTIDFSSSSTGTYLLLGGIFPQSVATNVRIISSDWSNIENVLGGTDDDFFFGNAIANHISGAAGNDFITGEGGNDTIEGGSGNDGIIGNEGDDYLNGQGSDDSLNGGTGNDTLVGGSGNDLFTVETDASETVFIIESANEGIDAIYFDGNAQVSISLSAIGIQTVALNVRVNASNWNQIENLYGGQENDRFFGNSLNNTLQSYGGNDFLSGLNGNDLIETGAGNDILTGGSGNDTLNGGDGTDMFVIDADVDTGIDTILETTTGGVDILDFRTTTGKAITLNLGLLTVQTVATSVQLIMPAATIEYAYGGSLGDNLTGNALNNYLLGGAGNDKLNGSLGSDYLNGSAGDDILIGGVGNDRLIGDANNDFYIIDADVDFGLDTIQETTTGGIDVLDFRTTAKAIAINLGLTTAQTIAANIQLVMPLATIEYAYGGAGSDKLTGNNLGNYLLGGGGNDTLDGGASGDLLRGEAGVDSFYFSGGALTGANTVASILGRDNIADFAVGIDKIALSKATFTAVTGLGAIGSNFLSVATDAIALTGTQNAAIVYSRATGNLFYNQNGTAAGFGVNGGNFAVLSNLPTTLAATDFVIVA
jgi:Ca2+-binding RTX toxin-like protein